MAATYDPCTRSPDKPWGKRSAQARGAGSCAGPVTAISAPLADSARGAVWWLVSGRVPLTTTVWSSPGRIRTAAPEARSRAGPVSPSRGGAVDSLTGLQFREFVVEAAEEVDQDSLRCAERLFRASARATPSRTALGKVYSCGPAE
ncbi:hypothetical protein HEK131_42780 [Streptomyces seoulensis]|nr:hypothetical protein HEK131_42780 [Streptomyces seoulensis]